MDDTLSLMDYEMWKAFHFPHLNVGGSAHFPSSHQLKLNNTNLEFSKTKITENLYFLFGKISASPSAIPRFSS